MQSCVMERGSYVNPLNDHSTTVEVTKTEIVRQTTTVESFENQRASTVKNRELVPNNNYVGRDIEYVNMACSAKNVPSSGSQEGSGTSD